MEKKISAFGYMRCSGQGQVSGDTWARQSKAIKSYAAAHGFRLVKLFREEAVSGTLEHMDRPAWRNMMSALFRNGTKTIIVEHLDRLTRNLVIQETTVAMLQREGFTLISTKQPDLMAIEPDRVAMRQMQGVFAQLEKSNLVIKLRVARDRKSTHGKRCEGRKPFGTRPDEQKVLARMKALASDGLDHNQIADRLNAEHKPTRTGKLWSGVVVKRIIERNPPNTVEQDVVKALQSLGASRKDAEAAVARVRRDGDTFDSLFRRASAAR